MVKFIFLTVLFSGILHVSTAETSYLNTKTPIATGIDMIIVKNLGCSTVLPNRIQFELFNNSASTIWAKMKIQVLNKKGDTIDRSFLPITLSSGSMREYNSILLLCSKNHRYEFSFTDYKLIPINAVK
jgi:hypothetical protein